MRCNELLHETNLEKKDASVLCGDGRTVSICLSF